MKATLQNTAEIRATKTLWLLRESIRKKNWFATENIEKAVKCEFVFIWFPYVSRQLFSF